MDEQSPFFQSMLDSSLIEFDRKLAHEVGQHLARLSWRVCVAETVTNGLVTQSLATTAAPNMSGSLICMSPHAAVHLGGIPPSTVREHGLGSVQAATELVKTLQQRFPQHLCIAVTGQWEQRPTNGDEQRGLVHLVFRHAQHQKEKTFPLVGSTLSFPDQATKCVLATLKNWIQFIK